MYLSELQSKDIISVKNGINLGRIVDAEVSIDGKIIKLIAEDKRMFRRVFKNNEISFNFNEIIKIGSDCILVNK